MSEKKPTEETTPNADGALTDEALDGVSGGVSLLLPAVQAAREAAAFNGDGAVDGTDFLVWQQGLAKPARKK